MVRDCGRPCHAFAGRLPKLETAFMKLGTSPEDLKKSGEIAGELLDLGNRLDAVVSIRDGMEVVFRKRDLLPKRPPP